MMTYFSTYTRYFVSKSALRDWYSFWVWEANAAVPLTCIPSNGQQLIL